MCNFHYQGFVNSITELLKVRGEAQKLKVRESCLDTVLGDSGWPYLSRGLGPDDPTSITVGYGETT